MLNNIDKKNPFKVPENYFEDFHKNMMSKISEEPKAVKIVPLWRKVIPWASVAAVLGGIIILAGILTDNSEPQIADSNFITDQTEKVYASSAEDDDFYLFLEDEVIKDSYYSAINF